MEGQFSKIYVKSLIRRVTVKKKKRLKPSSRHRCHECYIAAPEAAALNPDLSTIRLGIMG